MKRLIPSFTLMTLLACPVLAQTVTPVPSLMNFQGRLTRPDGVPVADGSHTVIISLYDAATIGAIKWTETQTVAVKNGTFAVLLGSTTPLNDTVFAADRWLELSVDGVILMPRQRIVSTAFAFKANLANTVPDGSITSAKLSSSFLTAGGDLTGTFPNPLLATLDTSLAKVSGGVMSSKNSRIGIGETTPNALLTIGNNMGGIGPGVPGMMIGNRSGNAAFWMGKDSTNGMEMAWLDPSYARINVFGNKPLALQEAGGNVGIRTTTPTAPLHVNGRVKINGTNPLELGADVLGKQSEAGMIGYKTFSQGLDIVGAGTTVSDRKITFFNEGGATFDGTVNVPNLTVGGSNIPTGLTQELGGNNPILNLDVNFRHPNTNQAFVGGAIRIDGRSPSSPLFQFFARSANSAVESNLLAISEQGNIGVGANPSSDKIFIANSTDNPTITLQASGRGNNLSHVHFGTTGDWYIRSASSTGKVVIEDSGGNTGIGTSNPLYKLDVNGTLRCFGFTNSSDARWKTNVETVSNPLETILALHGVTFEWKKKEFKELNLRDGRQIGFLAQEVEKVLPNLVTTDDSGYKSVAYTDVIPVLVEAIKAQQKQREGERAELQAVKEENAQIKALLKSLNSRLMQLEATQETRK